MNIAISLWHPKFYDLLINLWLNLEKRWNKVFYINWNKIIEKKYKLNVITKRKSYIEHIHGMEDYKLFMKEVYKISTVSMDSFLQKKLKKTEDIDNIDLFIFWNWINFYEYALAKALNKKIICLENWYLPNTLQIWINWINASNQIISWSKDKVNKLSDEKKLFLLQKWKKETHFIKINSHIKIISWLIRLYSFWFLISFKLLHFYINNVFYTIVRLLKIKLSFKNELKNFINISNKRILYIFQVHDDTQIFINTNICTNSTDIVNYSKKVFESLWKKSFMIKLHPLDIWRYNYKPFIKKNNIDTYYTWNVDDFFLKSQMIVTINSSVWYQAISRWIKTIIFWDALYKSSDYILEINENNLDKIDTLIKDFSETTIDRESNNKYLKSINNLIFFTWSWAKVNKENLSNLIENIYFYNQHK